LFLVVIKIIEPARRELSQVGLVFFSFLAGNDLPGKIEVFWWWDTFLAIIG